MNSTFALHSKRALVRILIVVLAGYCLPTSVHAQVPVLEPNAVHWAYSAYFGTGWYKVRDEKEVFVLRTSPKRALREAGLSDLGERTVGIDVKLTITAGLDSFSFDDLPGAIRIDNLASLSAMPGIDITVPVNERWTLRPHASIGWGRILGESDSAWAYWAGLKSRYAFVKDKLDWAVVNSIAYVGYTPSEGSAADFWPLMAGVEFDYPLAVKTSGGEQLFLRWHGTYTTFGNDLDLDFIIGLSEPIRDQWELGFSFHKEESRIKMGWFKFERLGLAYRASSNGNLKGINLVFRSTFNR